MSNLSIRKIEHLVEKYIIVQSSLEDLLDNCGMLIHDHNIKRLLPLVAYNESNTLIQELMKSFFRKLPLQDYISEDQEPANTFKDNLQSAIKVEILPEPQQQFITSVTKFIVNSPLLPLQKSFAKILYEILSHFFQKILIEQIRQIANPVRLITYNIFSNPFVN